LNAHGGLGAGFAKLVAARVQTPIRTSSATNNLDLTIFDFS